MIDSALEFAKMAAAEADLWWYRCLHERVLNAVVRRFGADRDVRFVDAACGSGGLLARLRSAGYRNLRAFDLSEHAIRHTVERGFTAELCDVRSLPGLLADGSTDVIVMNDLVNYVPLGDWPATMRALHAKLSNRGIVVLNIAALNAFEGAHDRAVGLRFRIEPADIPTIADPELFRPLTRTYWPFLLSPLIYAARTAQRRALHRNPDAAPVSDVSLPHPLLNVAFGALTRVEARLLRSAPCGSSLFMVLARP